MGKNRGQMKEKNRKYSKGTINRGEEAAVFCLACSQSVLQTAVSEVPEGAPLGKVEKSNYYRAQQICEMA